jgi:pyruvate formate lyase activating enzyme
VTLLVPGFNEGEGELRDMARFLVSVSRDIPWHVTAFHPDYKMTDPPSTSVAQLVRAAEIGTEAGLRFVYAGNAPGRVGPWEHTWCPNCREKLIERHGFRVREYRVTPDGKCPKCGTAIPGIWHVGGGSELNRLSGRSRLPRRVELV